MTSPVAHSLLWVLALNTRISPAINQICALLDSPNPVRLLTEDADCFFVGDDVDFALH